MLLILASVLPPESVTTLEDLFPKTDSKSTLRPADGCGWATGDGVNPVGKKRKKLHVFIQHFPKIHFYAKQAKYIFQHYRKTRNTSEVQITPWHWAVYLIFIWSYSSKGRFLPQKLNRQAIKVALQLLNLWTPFLILPYAYNKITEEKVTMLLQEKKRNLFQDYLTEDYSSMFYINPAILWDTTEVRSKPFQGAWTHYAFD